MVWRHCYWITDNNETLSEEIIESDLNEQIRKIYELNTNMVMKGVGKWCTYLDYDIQLKITKNKYHII